MLWQFIKYWLFAFVVIDAVVIAAVGKPVAPWPYALIAVLIATWACWRERRWDHHQLNEGDQ